ncbi:hypothetical protein P7D85_11015 [Enterococcus hulanensis]|uniref:Uncharacterized protein n=1 Tax=Enterococcus hulanensis TaxID=2559929 RepID=A0ABU3EZK4_9ENTE|nr:hypothetical protein [Enterococcus hulanensis]MDT2600307.1 hypothetical protein [Enterococcus hulanensis]MDT2609120.1 hypothetical protein [Enterococcus hulanensis]MDT2616838.1 hypothetical protein [Enterococcus hulanensis]MDT2628642.1 hypothetical protein [Enterococcus hulanensis]MDT2655982.1 hypothetical protein [Enterococcus hulanensis]
MKKIFRLLLLGLLTLVFMLPNIAIASENVKPDIVPDTEIITLKNGEFYDFTRESVVFAKETTVYKVDIYPQDPGLYSYQILSTIALVNGEYLIGDLRPTGSQNFSLGSSPGIIVSRNFPGERISAGSWIPMEFGIRIKNYEAAPATFKLVIDINHYNL